MYTEQKSWKGGWFAKINEYIYPCAAKALEKYFAENIVYEFISTKRK